MLLDYYTSQLGGILGKNILTANVENWDIRAHTTSKHIIPVLFFLKNNSCSRFTVLTDIVALDYPQRPDRFSLVYNLVSVKYNSRIFVQINIKEGEAVPSVFEVYPSSNWMEREAWDLVGIFFAKHPDLRRILTDYGFVGHPLRKDFPLTGYLEVRYDTNKSRIVYEPVELSQEYRDFSFNSPWKI